MAPVTPIFADYNATTPLCPPVVNRMADWAHIYGNMSSGHSFGQQVAGLYDDGIDHLQTLLGAKSYDVFTCSSATEANNWWLHSLIDTSDSPPVILASAIEHPSVLIPLQHYHQQGRIHLDICNVHANGMVDMAHLDTLLTPATTAVSIMAANNELGTIQPMATIANMAKKVGALVHTDAVQLVGKGPVYFDEWDVDAITLSSHKCYAPTGCGVLLVKSADDLSPLLRGGMQQQRQRGGTVHVMGLDLMVQGIQYCADKYPSRLAIHDWAARDLFCQSSIVPIAPLQSSNPTVLWNTVSLGIPGKKSHDIMMALDTMGIAVATGSSCSTGATDVSPVIKALGLPDNITNSAIRLSFGYPTTAEDLTAIAQAFQKIAPSLNISNK